MSQSRRDPRKARHRRDRIRREKAAGEAPSYPSPGPAHPFASERAFCDIHALLDEQKSENQEQLNERLQKLMASGQLTERAQYYALGSPEEAIAAAIDLAPACCAELRE